MEFLSGAGDLRRALLTMEIDAPGDVELYVQFKNRALGEPVTLNKALDFLKKHGVNAEKEFQAIFGKEKHIDIMVRDQKSLETNGPYVNNHGKFENMGDNSLNRLLYSHAKNEIIGLPEDLAALANGKVTFTESSKTTKFPEAKAVQDGLKTKSFYARGILRMALRSLRLS